MAQNAGNCIFRERTERLLLMGWWGCMVGVDGVEEELRDFKARVVEGGVMLISD